MLNPKMMKTEIEDYLQGKGTYIQINELTDFLRNDLTMDMKKFICRKLAELYESKKMFKDAAKMHNNIALISITFADKIKAHTKETEFYIRAGDFHKSDEALRRAMGEANTAEKKEIYFQIIHFYREEARAYEEEGKKGHAMKIYEKLLEMNLNNIEKKDIQEKLLELYQKLGEFRKYNMLRGIAGK